MRFDLERLEQVRKRHGLSLIVLHGSQVDKKTHPESDVDIAVVRKDDNVKLALLELMKDVSETFGSDKIDISDLTHADPLFLFSAMQKSRLLAGSREEYDKLMESAFKKYCDYLPYLEKEKRFVLERVKSYVAN